MMDAHRKRWERRQKQRELHAERKKQGKGYPATSTLPNRKSSLKTVDEEKASLTRDAEEILEVYSQQLRKLLPKLARIPDPRNPRKVKHRITLLMLYGIFMFAFHLSSRREANREMTTPQLLENLKALFPELVEMPHQDTLCRLLQAIDVGHIETAYLELLKKLIRNKTFGKFLPQKRYLVAVDGTQKHVVGEGWDERYLRRRIPGQDGAYQYYAYVLEAVLILSNGMVLPLLSEFLENTPELEAILPDETWRQDCELNAFHRLAKRLKREFPKLPLTLLLDGLYANGPVMKTCLKNKWYFMIVLKDKSLPTVWEEARGLLRLDTEGEYRHEREWQGRNQVFRWVNDIEYRYGAGSRAQTIGLHLVTCGETWEIIDESGHIVVKTGRHAWLSSHPITRKNVHGLCNLTARKRWLHENSILKEKHHGYSYEHIFSHHWDAMRGYHYLMHIARLLNELALHSVSLEEQVKAMGIRSIIRKFREVLAHRELDATRLRRLTETPGQLRLVPEESWRRSVA